ncbi:reverse transcriptase domain-containing protein [Tanacetum coccineum]
MEKLILALVYVERQLRRYFQAHLVAVIMGQPIRQILSRTENSRRVAKWAIELGKHAISYRPRTSIRGQVLAAFLAEVPLGEISRVEEATEALKIVELWKLFTYGSSNKGGLGAELILKNPDDVEFTYALRFKFKASNNEAKYEALLAGLRIADSDKS